MARIAAVVLNWQRADDTLRCIRSLLECDYPALEVVVVDNGSGDDSSRRIGAAYPDLPLLQAPENLGYAGGNNLGIRWALARGADHLFLLNNDAVVAPDCISRLAETLAGDEAIAQAGPLIIEAARDGSASAGGEIRWECAEPRHLSYDANGAGESPDLLDVGYLPGTAVLVRGSCIREVGLLPEDYFLYFEDVAWSLRFQSRGWRTVVNPAARVFHWESSSAGRNSPLKLYYYVRNNLYFIDEWRMGTERWRTMARVHGKLVRLLAKQLAAGAFSHGRAVVLGYLDYRRRRQGRARHDL